MNLNEPTQAHFEPSALSSLVETLGHQFQREELLTLALTHKSFANEQASGYSGVRDDNERLEFLGDAVLDLAISDILMARFPADPEGALSKKRASLVNEDALAKVATALKLETLIRLGKGEVKTGGLQKPRILASAFEALVGAVFQDAGFAVVRNLIERLMDARLNEIATATVDFSADFKTRLQEKAQETRKATPTYRVESESGPDHDKVFVVAVDLGGEILATGTGRSKKAAEQDAARTALEQM
jgi:ribonuclease III